MEHLNHKFVRYKEEGTFSTITNCCLTVYMLLKVHQKLQNMPGNTVPRASLKGFKLSRVCHEC